MYLCFVDESGHVPSKKRSNYVRNFVIAALIIPEAQWHGIANEFAAAKRRFNVDGEIKWQYFGPDNEDKNNSLQHLEFDCRCKLRDQLLKTITSRRSVRIVATRTITKAAWQLPYITDKTSMYHYTYKQTLERVNYFLQDISKTTGETQRGIVIADH